MSLIGSAPAGITIDRFIAERAAESDPIPHLPLAVVKRAEEQHVRAITAAGEHRPITMRADPADVYRLLFGATASDRNASLRSRRVLDLLAPQVKAAQARLAGDERGNSASTWPPSRRSSASRPSSSGCGPRAPAGPPSSFPLRRWRGAWRPCSASPPRP
jgi:hypothetical protein